jgi:hypothetical protein
MVLPGQLWAIHKRSRDMPVNDKWDPKPLSAKVRSTYRNPGSNIAGMASPERRAPGAIPTP